MCGGLFENETGVITSPNYPNPYEDSRTCLYEILAPLGKAIILHFEDFDLEDTSYPDCDYDYLKVFDGIDANATEVGKYCGATIPSDSTSTLNVMVLQFQTDASISTKGFKATYNFIDVKCGGVIKSLGHEIQPPLGSNSVYEHDSDCLWVIVAPIGFVVQITFHTFHLEHSSDCSLDYVALYDGNATNSNKIQSYCGSNLPPVVQSNTNILSIKFVTDSSVAGEGFRAQYAYVDSSKGFEKKYFLLLTI